jgi:hypothetical protein
MIMYHVTVKIATEKCREWLQWMKTVHIPEVLDTGYFVKCRLSKLDSDENDGETYSVLYDCPSREKLNKYMSLNAPALQKKHIDKFAGHFVAFRTTLEVDEELFPRAQHS